MHRLSSRAVAASHIEELEGYIQPGYTLGLWGEKKKEEDWQEMLAQGQFSSPPPKPPPKKVAAVHLCFTSTLQTGIMGKNEEQRVFS